MSEQKVMLVTGASRGIGAATARLAAARGYALIVNFNKDEEAASRLLKEISDSGSEAIPARADVGSEKDVVAMFESADRRFGRLDVLVNNAGILDRRCRVDSLGLERMERMFRINIIGSFLCAREAVRRMSTVRGGHGGSIVNVSSRAAPLGGGGEYVDYAASKGAIDTLTVGLASEVAEEGIRVNAVRPGLIYTDIHASGGRPDRVDDMKDGIPMKRGGTPQEVAESILWLAGEKSSYCTGTFIDVGGGR